MAHHTLTLQWREERQLGETFYYLDPYRTRLKYCGMEVGELFFKVDFRCTEAFDQLTRHGGGGRPITAVGLANFHCPVSLQGLVAEAKSDYSGEPDRVFFVSKVCWPGLPISRS